MVCLAEELAVRAGNPELRLFLRLRQPQYPRKHKPVSIYEQLLYSLHEVQERKGCNTNIYLPFSIPNKYYSFKVLDLNFNIGSIGTTTMAILFPEPSGEVQTESVH